MIVNHVKESDCKTCYSDLARSKACIFLWSRFIIKRQGFFRKFSIDLFDNLWIYISCSISYFAIDIWIFDVSRATFSLSLNHTRMGFVTSIRVSIHLHSILWEVYMKISSFIFSKRYKYLYSVLSSRLLLTCQRIPYKGGTTEPILISNSHKNVNKISRIV